MFTKSENLSSMTLSASFKKLSLSFFYLLIGLLSFETNCRTLEANQPVYSAVVLDGLTGKIIYEENAHQQTCPASLTKMMTLLITFEALERKKISLNSLIKISKHAHFQAPSKLGLRLGSRITVKNAILALITRSANDIASALGEHIGGTEPNFAKMMTQKALSIGMRNTTFKNASGLPASGQKTTAMDMATLSLYLIKKHPGYYKLFRTKNFTYAGWHHRNHNNLLWTKKSTIQYDGIKTGYIKESGFNLAASAIRGNKRMIAVVMGGKTRQDRDRRVDLLLNCAFNNNFSKTLISPARVNTPWNDDPIAKLISVSTNANSVKAQIPSKRRLNKKTNTKKPTNRKNKKSRPKTI